VVTTKSLVVGLLVLTTALVGLSTVPTASAHECVENGSSPHCNGHSCPEDGEADLHFNPDEMAFCFNF
jgi:hypothetical protein